MTRNIDDLFIHPYRSTTDEDRSVIRLVRQWAEKEILSRRMEYRENYASLFPERRKKLDIDLGLKRLILPEKLGGFGWDSNADALGILSILIEIGRADAAIGFLNASAYALFAACSPDLDIQNKSSGTLPDLLSDERVGTVALIVPGPGIAGRDYPLFKGRAIVPQAQETTDGYNISGADLRPLSAGSIADLFCVVCARNNGTPCVALIPRYNQGVSVGKPFLSTGLNACGNANVSFARAHVPDQNVFGRESVVERLFIWSNLLLAGVSIGAATNFFELLSDWSDNRVIKGGTTLKENPLCASVLADVAEDIALSRLLLFDLAQIVASPGSFGNDTIVRTFTFAEMIGNRVHLALMHAMNRGLELMGSAGYAKEWHVEKHWRDVKTIQSILCGVAAEAPVKMDTARFFYNCTEI